jgi:predicted RecA/RadA family phage recombinase
MNTYKNNGRRIDYTNSSGSLIASGATVIVRSGTAGVTGVLVTDIADTATGEIATCGVHTLTKEAGAIAYGALVYRKSSNGNITTATTGNTLAGWAVAAATTSATTVDVLLNGLPGSN